MKASERLLRTRRPLGIWGQILCGFGIFILVVAALLWLFQIVLLDPFYRAVKTTEVKATAETVQHALEASDMNEQVRQMCLNTGINIVVTDEHGQMLSGWKASEKESYLENLSRSRLKMSNLFNEVNLKGGDQLMVARSPFVNQDGSQDEVILYVTITRTPSGLNRMVLLESAITPVDSLQETLQVQVTTLTVVMAAMGVLPLEKTRFNLTESIRGILHRYDKLADYHFPFLYREEVWVDADELKISQVVYNLVNNAITYSGKDKTITLRQELWQGKVRVSVTDTGEGIPQEKLKDIWERYYKVDKEHKRAQMGSGLGLSIVKNILDMHGGTYGVTSTLGQGSTFWFELPVVQQTPEGLPGPQG